MKEEILARISECGVPRDKIGLEFQENESLGHYSTSAAFLVARQKNISSKAAAEELAALIEKNNDGFFSRIEVAGAGFINFWISPAVFQKETLTILNKGEAYGKNDAGKGRKARVEYVSANPTGPIHIGNARGGPYGESLARTFLMSGYEVTREYYNNDIGGQIEKLGATLFYWYKKELGGDPIFPENGYQGEFPREIAVSAVAALGRDLKESDVDNLINFGLEEIYKENFDVLERLGIKYDIIREESELISSGATERAIEELRSRGFLKEYEGALWFAPKDEFLEDREAVVVKSDGTPTYFASDIAYHREKFKSGSNKIIDIFGSNHFGHIPKLRALTNIFGFNPDDFYVLLYQSVRVKRGGEVLKMSKRAGTYITAREVIDEVGPDAMIFSFLSSASTTHIDFDLEEVKKRSMKNPVYYVQYAYVRARNVIRKLGEYDSVSDLSVLASDTDILLMRKMAEFPDIIAETLKDFCVHRYTRYAYELARVFHNFYEKERVLNEDEPAKSARAALVEAFAGVMQNTLSVMGISSPEEM